MKTILHVSCSPRGQSAESYRLSQMILGHLLQRDPQALVIERAIGRDPIQPIDEAYATSQQDSGDTSREGTMMKSEELVRELEGADCVVIGTPMHNMTVPASLKSWIDHVVRVRRTFEVTPAGKVGLLPDRPVFVAIASGGRFSGDRARQPDFLTPYLKAVMGMIGLLDVTFFSIQSTGSGQDAVAKARIRTGLELAGYFSSQPTDEG
ncbi:FMN-dependent NADH-azoreductase [Plastoroseomonas hellenica]|uniref:FMN-dependent NADH-azoreductase n=1 Tax=Plastoroseomonas hellenica TaxID=2687306 RepID=UPI001BA8491E|nr:NAD(P)H-dependent oxidoreductase [Plastoroseomonas hellenica]MBR0641376.1 flavodoxin family protein [Plastoroseomonas hellenica]